MKPLPLGYHLQQFAALPIQRRSELGVTFAVDYHRLYNCYPIKRLGVNNYSDHEFKMILALKSLDRVFRTRVNVLIA
jgi:hypothetical protein